MSRRPDPAGVPAPLGLKEEMRNAIIDNLRYAHEQGTDRPELANWTWPH